MGLGHVPQEPIRSARANPEFQGRQRRGTPARGSHGPRLDRTALARAGEDRAAAWYVAREYELLDRNWRCRVGEIDLVLARPGVLVISEVKTRSTDYFGAPAHAVTTDKQRRLRRLAVLWLADHGLARRSIRFDVVEVVIDRNGTRINVIEAAF